VRRVGLKRQEIDVSADQHSIFLNIEGSATSGENYIDGNRTVFVRRPEGSLTYVPPGRTWSGWDDGDSTASYLFVSVQRHFARNLFEEFTEASTLQPELGFRDLAIQFAARKIASELAQSDRASGLLVEGYLTTIFGLMLRRSQLPQKTLKGGLSPMVLKKIIRRIEEEPTEKLTLTDLSQEFGMSTAHLCRAFKQSTGVSPHAFLNSRRIECASNLLRTTSYSITQIALMCGYSSGSHLSTNFLRELGVPPAVYRSAWSK
jgi:AraC-like DNA-binding protein